MANAARLEVDLPFAGKVYTVKPTFEVIAGIEGATGQSCSSLAKKFYSRDPDTYASLSITAMVLLQVLRPLDKTINLEKISDTLMDDGCIEIWSALGDICSRAIKGHKEHIRVAEAEILEKKRLAEAAGEGTTIPPQETGDAASKIG